MPQELPEKLSEHMSIVRVDEPPVLSHCADVDFEADFPDGCSVRIRARVPLKLVAITAARSALESLLKVYIEDRGLAMPRRPKTDNLLKVAMGDLGLDPADKADKGVRSMLQGLWSVVYGIADLRTHAGSAHGHGKHPYQLQARHARLADVHRVLRRNLELSERAILI